MNQVPRKFAQRTEMIASRQSHIVLGIGAAMLLLLLPGCALLAGREESPSPPPVMPQAKEEVSKPEGPKVEQVGEASWYGPAQNGKGTASGETFDQNALTAAHPTLPLGTKAVVTNLETGQSVAVTINDRGPYVKGRKIDLSRAAAQRIGMTKKGVTRVKIAAAPPAKPTKPMARTTKNRITPVAARTDMPTPSPQ